MGKVHLADARAAVKRTRRLLSSISTGCGNSRLIGRLRGHPRRFKPGSAWLADAGTRWTAAVGTEGRFMFAIPPT